MDSPAPRTKVKVNLTGAEETLLWVLAFRAADAASASPILGDRYAAELVDRLDYDWAKAKVKLGPSKAAIFAMRARFLDRWTADFLDEARQSGGGDKVTVLHLAAGLDTRAHRLQDRCPPGRVLWVDVDLPEVVRIRRQVVPDPAGMPAREEGGDTGYELAGADVTDPKWLAGLGLPRGQRTVVVAEGLTPYLTPEQGRGMVEALTAYFVAGGNWMVLDMMSPAVLWLSGRDAIIRATGARMKWAVGDPRELEGWHEGLRLREEVLAADNPENADLPWLLGWLLWLASWVPLLRTLLRYTRYEW